MGSVGPLKNPALELGRSLARKQPSATAAAASLALLVRSDNKKPTGHFSTAPVSLFSPDGGWEYGEIRDSPLLGNQGREIRDSHLLTAHRRPSLTRGRWVFVSGNFFSDSWAEEAGFPWETETSAHLDFQPRTEASAEASGSCISLQTSALATSSLGFPMLPGSPHRGVSGVIPPVPPEHH